MKSVASKSSTYEREPLPEAGNPPNYRPLHGSAPASGHGFLEIVYKDAIDHELRSREMFYEREKQYDIFYKGQRLPHKFFADFVIFDQVILEVKAADGIPDEFIAQTLNYLKVSENKVGLIVNFGKKSLQWKRLVF